MANLTISRVNALPTTIASNTMYLVKNATTGLLDIYVAGNDPTKIQHVASQQETLSSVMLTADVAPDLAVPQMFWFDSSVGTLFVKYYDTAASAWHWVEAMPTIAVPEFAGTGVANTMARSDHNHDQTYSTIGAMEW